MISKVNLIFTSVMMDSGIAQQKRFLMKGGGVSCQAMQ
jgi:hypothetical protein